MSRGINLVLNRAQILGTTADFDLTPAVAEVLNKVLPGVVVPPDGVSPLTNGGACPATPVAARPAPTGVPAPTAAAAAAPYTLRSPGALADSAAEALIDACPAWTARHWRAIPASFGGPARIPWPRWWIGGRGAEAPPRRLMLHASRRWRAATATGRQLLPEQPQIPAGARGDPGRRR